MTRIESLDPFDDQPLRSQVRLSYQIEFAFIRNAERATEPLGQQMTGGARSLDGEVEQTRSLFAARRSFRPARFPARQAHLLRGNLQHFRHLPIPVSPIVIAGQFTIFVRNLFLA